MVASQIVRLQQTDVAMWLAVDYAGRLLSLAILLLAPAVRGIAFKREPLTCSAWEAAVWVVGLVVLAILVRQFVRIMLGPIFPGTQLGFLPSPHGTLLLIDSTVGLALVATHEEIVFRRLARAILRPKLGDGFVMVIASATLFGLYHWQFGVGTIVTAIIFGIFAMLFYKRAGTIAPVVIAHYLADAWHEVSAAV